MKTEEIIMNKLEGYQLENDAKTDTIDYNINDLTKENIIRLVKTVDDLQLENLDLKNEISYYENYLKFLKDNYIFILKSLDISKEIFNKIGEQDEKLD